MATMKKTLLILSFGIGLSGLCAQEQPDTVNVERQINIEKEYTPEIKDLKRRPITYQVEEFTAPGAEIEYSNYITDVSPKSQFSPVEAEALGIAKMRKPKDGFAEIGLGFNMNWQAEGYYKILDNEINDLDVHVGHWGTYWGDGSKRNPKADIRSLVNFDFSHLTENGHQLSANAQYRNSYYSFYGQDVFNWDSLGQAGQFQCRHTLNLGFGSKSVRSIKKEWDYTVDGGMRMNNFQYLRTTQFNVFAEGHGFKRFGAHQIELMLRGEGIIYSGENVNAKGNAIVELAPYYNFNNHWLDAHVGVRLLTSCLRDNVFYAMPDVNFTFHTHKMVWINLNVTGDYASNSLASMVDICPYARLTDDGIDTYTPVDAKLGVTVMPVGGLSINAGFEYKYVMNDRFFRNEIINDIAYSRYFVLDKHTTHNMIPYLTASYTYKDRYRVFANFRYWYGSNAKDDATLYWNCPAWELHIGVEIQPINDLNIGLNYYFASGMVRMLGPNVIESANMPDIHDLNISASYLIKKKVTVFVNANNILGSIDRLRWSTWNGYESMGFNMVFGARMAF